MRNLIIILSILLATTSCKINTIIPEKYSEVKFENKDWYRFTIHNGIGYINGDDGVNGLELWVFDDNNELKMLKDINPSGSSDPLILSEQLDTYLLFMATDDIGMGLWSTDGTESGTRLLTHLEIVEYGYGGKLHSYKSPITRIQDKLYIKATDEKGKFALWSTDGTPEGTKLAVDLNSIGINSVINLQSLNDKIIFASEEKDWNASLWASDGTTSGTHKLLNDEVWGQLQEEPIYFDIYLSKIYFVVEDSNNYNVWLSDCTVENTHPYNRDSDSLKLNISKPLGILNNSMFFEASPVGESNYQLWLSDGTKENTRFVKEITPGGSSMLDKFYRSEPFEEKLFFMSDTYEDSVSLWCTDGTSEGTVRLTQPELNDIQFYRCIIEGSKMYFAASTEEYGEELWFSDGTPEGTRMVKETIDGVEGGQLWFYGDMLDGKILFATENEGFGIMVLWATDGTEDGTYEFHSELDDLHWPIYTKRIGDYLYFNEQSNNDNRRFWRTDFTDEGTAIIMPEDATYNVHIENGFYPEIVLLGNYVYFFADYYGRGKSLYRISSREIVKE